MEEQKTLSMKTEEAKELPLIEEGDYNAKITDIETDQDGQFGKMLVFHFDIKGVDVTALCSQKLNPYTKLYQWVEILTGKKLGVDEELVLKDLIGKEALVTVRNRIVKDEKGSPQVRDGKNVETSSIKELRPKK